MKIALDLPLIALGLIHQVQQRFTRQVTVQVLCKERCGALVVARRKAGHVGRDQYVFHVPQGAAGGQRFLFNAQPAADTSTPVTVVLNWEAALAR